MIHKLVTHFYYRTSPAWAIYKSLKRTEHLSISELRSLQSRKLQKLITHAYEKSPYWRRTLAEHDLSPAAIRSPEDLQRLPILEKSSVEAFLIEDDVKARGLVAQRTGGTTGEPTTLYCSQNHWHWIGAAHLRLLDWVGFKLGERRAKLFAAPTEAGLPMYTMRDRVKNWLANIMFLDALDMTPEHVESAIQSLRCFRPNLIIGYTSCMAILARALLQNGDTLGIPDLKIVNAAEPISAHTKEVIENGLGGRLFDHYGTREVGFIADECEQRSGLHVHMEYLVVEIVDENGRWVKDGEEGEILITELENLGMPVLRYRIGDRAVRSDMACNCGRGLQTIPLVTGRSTDVIVLPNGNKLTGLVFPHLLKDFPVAEYQITQKRPEYVEVKLVLESHIHEDDVLPNIRACLQRLLVGATLAVEVVNTIPRTKSGKLRSVVSEI